MESALLTILQNPESLQEDLRHFCNDYFASTLQFKPLFGGVLVEVGGRIVLDLMLEEKYWPQIQAALRKLPADTWQLEEQPLRDRVLLKISYLPSADPLPSEKVTTLEQLGLDSVRANRVRQSCESNGVVLIVGPHSGKKMYVMHSLLQTICSPTRTGAGWTDAWHPPHIPGFTWFNSSAMEEWMPREIKRMMRKKYDVIAWRSVYDKALWEALLHHAEQGALVVAGLFAECTVDALIQLRDLDLPEKSLQQIRGVLGQFPLETSGKDAQHRGYSRVFEWLELDQELRTAWLQGADKKSMLQYAGKQDLYCSLMEDAMRGVQQGLFDEARVKARLDM